ncbi:MAG: MarR family transcriptional regulator [Deltaproteobacteria bacterium]|nr:MarR family transcriptional regulator [Deltaproteobacteria bacterium]
MQENRDFQELRAAFIRIVSKYQALEKLPQDYGIGEVLYPAEIHAIEMIGKNPGMNVTELASGLGVTKGAVSQIIKKLNNKGLVAKYRDPRNEKAVLVGLTGRGRLAFDGHEAFHAQYDAEIMRLVSELPRHKVLFLREVFIKMEAAVDHYLKILA